MLSEEELARTVADAGRGDREAFVRLVRATEGMVSAVVSRIIEDSHVAEEVMQDVYVDAFRALQSWRPEARFTTWLYRSATLAALARRRSARRYRERLEAARARSGEAIESSDAPALAEAAEARRLARAAVEGLPPRQRDVFVLRHYRDLPVKQIAQVLGIAEGTVKSHLSSALQTLRARLSPEESGATQDTDEEERR